MPLKDHYLAEDWPQVLDEIQNLLDTSLKALQMAETAQFDKSKILTDTNLSLEILIALNRKKIDRDTDNKAVELVRNWY